MPDFHSLIKKHSKLPEEKQIEAGQAIAGKMTKEHETFLKELITLLDEKQIDVTNPESFINKKIYDKMPQEWKGKTDMALSNMAQQIRQIEDFYRSKQTPNESPHLETMIDYLWQMKQRIEVEYDVFKF